MTTGALSPLRRARCEILSRINHIALIFCKKVEKICFFALILQKQCDIIVLPAVFRLLLPVCSGVCRQRQAPAPLFRLGRFFIWIFCPRGNKLRSIGQYLVKYKIIILLCFALLVMLWVFFPRNLGRILLKDKSITDISLTYAVGDSPGDTVTMSQGQKDALLAAFNDTYVWPVS